MKKLITLLIMLAAQSGAAEVNYSNGYCVPIGEDLALENAVVQVTARRIHGGFVPIDEESEHNFFSPELVDNQLNAYDWGGQFRLEKVIFDPPGFEPHPVYFISSRLHYLPILPQLVQCVHSSE